MILNFVELSKNLFSTNKALRRCYTTTIEISQSIVYALTCNITCQSTFLLRMRNFLTPELLMDYGLIHQIICSNPSQASKFGRKMTLGLAQGFKINKKFADAIIISKTPKWVSNGSLLPAQHIVSFHYQNKRPTRLSCPLQFSDIYVEPLINQIKHWRARIISRDFEAYPKNMGYLIVADPIQHIFYRDRKSVV